MYTDCAEYGEWKNGHQATGLVIAASIFSIKFGAAVGAALPGFLLSGFGFEPNAVQDARAMDGILTTVSLVPAALFAAGAVVFAFYRLDRARMARIEGDLVARRAARVSTT